MIGRLIQKYQIRFFEQNFGQFDTHPPSATEFTGQSGKVFSTEAQAKQCFFNFSIVVDIFEGIKFFAQFGRLFYEFHVFIRVVISSGFQFTVQKSHPVTHMKYLLKCFQCLFKYCAMVFSE